MLTTFAKKASSQIFNLPPNSVNITLHLKFLEEHNLYKVDKNLKGLTQTKIKP